MSTKIPYDKKTFVAWLAEQRIAFAKAHPEACKFRDGEFQYIQDQEAWDRFLIEVVAKELES